MPPKGASDAGNRKIPEPIMLPMTRATVVQNPIVCLGEIERVKSARTCVTNQASRRRRTIPVLQTSPVSLLSFRSGRGGLRVVLPLRPEDAAPLLVLGYRHS